jgi:hypothetical protein
MFSQYLTEFNIAFIVGFIAYVAGVLTSTKVKDWVKGIPAQARVALNNVEADAQAKLKKAQADVLAKLPGSPVPVVEKAPLAPPPQGQAPNAA